MYVTIFVTDWGQKKHLAKLVLKFSDLKQCLPNSQHKLLQTSQYEAYIEAAQNFFEGRTIFDRDRGQKKHLAKLVLKGSVLKQSLPNSQYKLLQKSQYEAYIEAAQNFIEGHTIFDQYRGQKNHLAKLVLKDSVVKQILPNSQCKFLWRSQYESYIQAAQNLIEGRTIIDLDWAQKLTLLNGC